MDAAPANSAASQLLLRCLFMLALARISPRRKQPFYAQDCPFLRCGWPDILSVSRLTFVGAPAFPPPWPHERRGGRGSFAEPDIFWDSCRLVSEKSGVGGWG